ncbi:MAG: hypothetical protein HQM13_06290 [SAR324 cluster bacterium]|nr:hypothetical protein [SAR324 cluster bacterium]
MKKILLTAIVLLFGGYTLLAQEGAAPQFELMDLEGQKMSSRDFIGKQAVLVFFWATW